MVRRVFVSLQHWPSAWRRVMRALVVIGGCSGAPTLAEEPPEAEGSKQLLGGWKARQRLAAAGVSPFAVWTTEVWGNVGGGQQEGAWWNNLVEFGVELDTAKLRWWEGGGFMVQFYWVQSAPNEVGSAQYTGAFNPVSNIEAGDALRIFNLYYRHAWRNDALVVKAGQLAVDDDFMLSEYAGLFLNPAFGAMPSQVGTPLGATHGNVPAFPIYPVAAPGVYARWRPQPSVYTQVGLYYGRPGFDEGGNYGVDWLDETPAEMGLFWESGWNYLLAGRPGALRLGLSYHTGPLDDFGGHGHEPPATRQTSPNAYVAHDFAVLHDGEGRPKLGVFTRGGGAPKPSTAMVAWYVDAGLNWFGPVPCRPDDTAGVAISHTHFGSDYRRWTGPEGVDKGETTLELTYRAKVTSWMALQADIQLLFDPLPNSRSGSRATATVLGLRAELTF